MLKEEHKDQPGRSTAAMVLEQARIEALKANLRGELIQVGDEGYNSARKVYNGMNDKRRRVAFMYENWFQLAI